MPATGEKYVKSYTPCCYARCQLHFGEHRKKCPKCGKWFAFDFEGGFIHWFGEGRTFKTAVAHGRRWSSFKFGTTGYIDTERMLLYSPVINRGGQAQVLSESELIELGVVTPLEEMEDWQFDEGYVVHARRRVAGEWDEPAGFDWPFDLSIEEWIEGLRQHREEGCPDCYPQPGRKKEKTYEERVAEAKKRRAAIEETILENRQRAIDNSRHVGHRTHSPAAWNSTDPKEIINRLGFLNWQEGAASLVLNAGWDGRWCDEVDQVVTWLEKKARLDLVKIETTVIYGKPEFNTPFIQRLRAIGYSL